MTTACCPNMRHNPDEATLFLHADVLVLEYALKSPLPAGAECPVSEQTTGRAFIDPSSMQIVRLEQQRPRHDEGSGHPVAWSWSIDYARVTMDGKHFWLPKTISSKASSLDGEGAQVELPRDVQQLPSDDRHLNHPPRRATARSTEPGNDPAAVIGRTLCRALLQNARLFASEVESMLSLRIRLAPSLAIAATLLAALYFPLSRQEPRSRQTPPPSNLPATRLKVTSNLVVVRVVVRDAQGKPVNGLRKEDFKLFDSGKEQPIAQFEAESAVEPPSSPPVVARKPEQARRSAFLRIARTVSGSLL